MTNSVLTQSRRLPNGGAYEGKVMKCIFGRAILNEIKTVKFKIVILKNDG
jgi:hypothetical protein